MNFFSRSLAKTKFMGKNLLLYTALAICFSSCVVEMPILTWGMQIHHFVFLTNDSDKTESFLFFTDPHLLQKKDYTAERLNTYMGTIKNYFEATPLDFVICGGDWIGNGDTNEEALNKFGVVDSTMRALFHEKYYLVIGNHEYNYLSGPSEVKPPSEWLSHEQIRSALLKEREHTYYFFDGRNTRFYVLDTETGIYTNMDAYRWAQIDWLANDLIQTDSPFSAVVLHMCFSEYNTSPNNILTQAAETFKLIKAYNAKSSIKMNGKAYDFSSTTGKIKFVLTGHLHKDLDTTIDNTPVISTTWFRDGDTPTFDLVYVDYDNNKIYLIRVGTGENRVFDLS